MRHRGARRSLGCGACRQLKIKCDETQPSCARCLRFHRECTYPPQYRFVATNAKFDESLLQNIFSTQEAVADTLRTKLNLLSTQGDKDGTAHRFQLIRYRSTTPPSSSTPSLPLLSLPSLSREDGLASKLSIALRNCPEGYQLRHLGKYMIDLPVRLGHNPALDAAVECLLESHSQLLGVHCPSSGPATASSKYASALRALQGVIGDPMLGMSAETACAVILMCHYEMMVPERRGSQYVTHAQGASNLILLRGSGSVSTEFERSLLRTQTGQLIMSAFCRGEDCVLLQDNWQNAILGKQNNLKVTMIDRLFQTIYHIPSLVKYVSDFKVGKSNLNLDQLTGYAKRLQEELSSVPLGEEQTSSKVTESTDEDLGFDQVLSLTNDGVFPIVFSFRSREAAIFHSWRWMASLMVNICMDNLAPDPRLRHNMSEAAHRICMCYEYASLLKPLGALYLQLQLMVAYHISGQLHKDWILDKINVIVKDMHICFTSSYFEKVNGLIFKNLS